MMSSSQSVVLPSFDETFAKFVHKKMLPMMTRFAKRQLDGRFSSQEIHDMIDGDGLAYGLIHCISGQMKNILELFLINCIPDYTDGEVTEQDIKNAMNGYVISSKEDDDELDDFDDDLLYTPPPQIKRRARFMSPPPALRRSTRIAERKRRLSYQEWKDTIRSLDLELDEVRCRSPLNDDTPILSSPPAPRRAARIAARMMKAQLDAPKPRRSARLASKPTVDYTPFF